MARNSNHCFGELAMVLSWDFMQSPACSNKIAKVTSNCVKCNDTTGTMKPYCTADNLVIEARLLMLETTLRFEGGKECKNLMFKMHSGE